MSFIKRNKFWVFIISLLLIGLMLILFYYKERSPVWHDYPDSVIVRNYTEYQIDSSLMCMINKVSGIDSINLTIAYNDYIFTAYPLLEAALVKNIIGKNYTLLLNRGIGRARLPMILCHEMIHLEQYESGRLFIMEDSTRFDGVYYSNGMNYNVRPWELDAFNRGRRFYRSYKSFYYEK